MQYVNDDMDELFRRAAENYPLDTNNANWNKVWNALQDPEENPNENSNRKRRFFWLFALLPLSLIGYIYLKPSPQARQTSSKHNSETVTPVASKKQESSSHLISSSAKTSQPQAPAPVSDLIIQTSTIHSATANFSR